MTATPIPRSLALSLYGDLDLTELRELPAGRQPIITRRVRAEKRADCHEWLDQAVAGARPAGLRRVPARRGVRDRAGARRRGAARRARRRRSRRSHVGLVHGRQKAAERAATMRAFAAAEVQVLVATTVIEVGHRRPQRDGDGDRGRRPLRPLAAAPAARARRAQQRAVVLLPVRVAGAERSRAAAPGRRSASTRAASTWPRSTCGCAARASSRACASRARATCATRASRATAA